MDTCTSLFRLMGVAPLTGVHSTVHIFHTGYFGYGGAIHTVILACLAV